MWTCGRAAGGRREAGVDNQKQEPHTKMWGKIQGNQQALNDAERRGDVYQKDGYFHVKTIATAIVPCNGIAWLPSQPHQG